MNPSPELLKLAEALQPLVGLGNPHYKHDTPAGTPSTPYYTGPGGLFGVQGLDRDLISTRIQPMGISDSIPAIASPDMNPLFAYLTGFLDASGDEPTTVCDDAPTAGAGKGCLQTAVFGRYTRMTREFEVNRLGERINRGEFNDLTFMNDPIAEDIGGMFAQGFALGKNQRTRLGNEMLMRLMEVGVAFQNLLCPQVFTGNPDNNNGNAYKEFIGLDILIATGHRDAISGTTCPSLDSDVKDFNYGDVADTTLDHSIVETIATLVHYCRHNASKMNFGQCQWRFAMREDLFYALTAIWPVTYYTDRVANHDSAGIDPVGTFNSVDMINLRDKMRNGKYLLVDGVQFPVEFDDAIAEESSSDTAKLDQSCYASTIYFIPYTVAGGRPVFYWEYRDYSQDVLPQIAAGRQDMWYWTDGGRFLWHNKPPLNWCVQSIAKTEPRLILRTPQLAGKITHVAYCPLQHTRDAFPDQDYFVDGGVSTGRDAPSWYTKPA